MSNPEKMKRKIMNLTSLLGFIFIIFLGVNYYSEYQSRGAVIEGQIEVPADFAREFSRVIKKNRTEELPSTPFMDPEGNVLDWDDITGQYTLVNFWATWCGPCVIELPSFGELLKLYEGKNLNVVAISIDTMREHDFIKEFLDNRNIGEYAAYYDHQQNIQKNIKMRGIPTTYLLDPDGVLLYIFEGDADWNSKAAQRFFNQLLGNN
jgi:thiol-disulfide isomerase/thioredoxin